MATETFPAWMIQDTSERLARMGREGTSDLIAHIEARYPNLVDDLGQAISIQQQERDLHNEPN